MLGCISYSLFLMQVVLCLSPVGEAFRERCRMFPGLVNCTTIDWWDSAHGEMGVCDSAVRERCSDVTLGDICFCKLAPESP